MAQPHLSSEEILLQKKNLEQLTYIISHDLKSPAQNILSLVAFLRSADGMSRVEHEKYLNGLERAAGKICSTLADLESMVRLNAGRDGTKELVNLQHVLDDAILTVRDSNAKLAFDVESFFEKASFRCSKVYLKSIFLNLISNSVKYRQPQVALKVTVTSRMLRDSLCISYTDNGLGIDMGAHSDKVFGLYNRFHPHVEGRGMGLHMVKSQIELMGGKIALQSEVNRGCTFTLCFPN